MFFFFFSLFDDGLGMINVRLLLLVVLDVPSSYKVVENMPYAKKGGARIKPNSMPIRVHAVKSYRFILKRKRKNIYT